ncbi:hypothetical protein JGH11_02265 [Dysgonomonas sp. Marseille-P4677]|uniref:hypothetical protein n=1 Tax=Dysgonomonas sp. Marseille-P4677 TaxID=2364790 RepID=UPI0019126F07|nr:hypothetical protein [Dysgonomonas sp. Marseille-P4677]MBK5719690.1 hypothetical protein [Dysgonomonas sp. Marseille-P4677]
MKKIILSGIVAIALIASTSVMAQNVTPKKEVNKAKQEVKADTKAVKQEVKSDAKAAKPAVKADVKATKGEVKKEVKKELKK